ncbi:unnamed protein product [Bursaphelenchus xylophilus]|uniref:(pine wood nematode) hypothetical protein n=1 Tax=Bursaphelenchus xylophilus TaxID=6326 RepID=A0A7I8X494_BURXY|nr:unnamed protein product [Bursaphelenchus xylophilus]CAG9128735.1 unnamed protein product [Bursaphelenchus xylophilus]
MIAGVLAIVPDLAPGIATGPETGIATPNEERIDITKATGEESIPLLEARRLNGLEMPDDVKKDLCQQDWAPNKMTGAALKWVTETVNEQMRARNEEIDAVVRDRIQKAKVELEARLRAQIENEWKDEMEAARKREADTLARLKDMEKSLEDRRKELDLEKDKMNEERLQMLEAKSKAEMERNQLKEELDKLKKTEQHSILNKGGFQRAPIKFGFKS